MSLAEDDVIATLEHNSLWRVPRWLLSLRGDGAHLVLEVAAAGAIIGDVAGGVAGPLALLSAPAFLPDSFLGGSAPRLRSLDLNSVAFPTLRKLLLSASHHLVTLRLRNVPAAGYISPEEMVTSSPRWKYSSSNSNSLDRAPTERSDVSAHVSWYLEDLVARVDAPLLRDVAITLFKQLIFSILQFLQFIGRLETFKGLNRAEVTFSRRSVAITLSRPLSPQTGQQRRRPGIGTGTGTKNVHVVDRRTLTLRIFSESDGQISSLAQVCRSSLPPPLSTVERLEVCEDRDWRPCWRDDVGITQALASTGAKDLYLSEGIVGHVAPALQGHVGERAIDVFPVLRSVFLRRLQPSGPIQETEVIGQFLAARELSGHPVAVYDWERDAREVGD
ncbi:hypothetical protein BC826DRAFT_1108870 [Russula brevipes]|nr:hypothetical protein BC826DRAFT_1108870 [Russula brevipes]